MAHSIACAELISLLYLLHSVPSLPSSNSQTKVPLRQTGYSIPFHSERSLVSTLAFLSNAKDDPNHVTALCIMEEPESSSLSVLLAVNRRTGDDGNHLVKQLSQGFEEIFAIVSQVSEDRDTPYAEADIFNAIISMCSYRILRRLRFFANTRKIQRQPIKALLQAAIGSLKQLQDRKLGHLFSISVLFTEKAKETIKLADAWAKHQTIARLKDLVEEVHRLKEIGDIKTLLDIIPNRAMCPSARISLLNIINKVARYREAAHFLYRTAQRVQLVRKMKIVVVNLPEQAFHRLQVDMYTPRLASTTARIDAPNNQRDLGRICQLMKSTKVQAEDQFGRQTKRTLKEAKIHAEIQLVFYHELYPSKLPPRVISSSKDACFLCNAFILMHGKMHMSRCHGRLYPGWRLPLIPQSDDMQRSFNVVLESKIRESLSILFSRGHKTIYPDPNESTLLTLSPSASTLRNATLPIEANEISNSIQLTREMVREDVPLILPETQALSTLSEEPLHPSSTVGPGAVPAIVEDIECQTSDHNTIQPLSMIPNESQSVFSTNNSTSENLTQGLALMRRSKNNHKSSFYTTGSLEVFIEPATEHTQLTSKCDSKDFEYSIEWLGAEEVKKLGEYETASIIDVEAMQSEKTWELNEQNCLLIAAGETVVKILCYSGSRSLGH